MKEYQKNYWPLIVWALALLPAMLGAAALAERAGLDSRAMTALMMAVVVIMLIGLMWIILKGGYVYWINGGPSFEEAKAAGSEARREYARKHFDAMLKGGAAALTLLAAEYALGAHEMVMVLSVGVCVVIAAVSTIRIRWTEEGQDDSKN
ncbi:MAG: hypothetical protein IJO98_10100 [Clostridia bacterium]|nr:hypothetical protein [Clostridia bacterium]